MLGNNVLFNTEPSVRIADNKIIITGHFNDNVRCAKLTMLCEMYGADIKSGYAELPYNEKFLEDYKKYINADLKFSISLAVVALVGLIAAAVAGAAGGIGWGVGANNAKDRNADLRKWLQENYPNLTEAQIEDLINNYGDDAPQHIFDFGAWGDQTDRAALEKLLADVKAAYEKYGDMPEDLSPEELAKIQQDAYDEIDAENQRLLALYDQSYRDSTSQLQNEFYQNAAMFNDYRNQILTNEAMNQQAIVGATRYELDRQQRNAITRGASAAQRLVANINVQLGLQASSAQQALDTSNALAQNLLAHRQAQQNVRMSYLNVQNQHNNNIASVLSGQAERRFNYGRNRKQDAIDDRNYAYDVWDRGVSNSGLGPTGEGIYRSTYGNRQNKNSGL